MRPVPASRHVVTLALALLAGTSPAGQTRIDGHALLARCTDDARQGACINELIAMADMHDVVAVWGLAQASWCMPGEVAPARLREVVVRHLREAGTRLDEPSSRLIADAYARAFPCR